VDITVDIAAALISFTTRGSSGTIAPYARQDNFGSPYMNTDQYTVKELDLVILQTVGCRILGSNYSKLY